MNRSHQGQRNFHAGLAAEAIAARGYLDQGFSEIGTRWRGRGGEIDLIMQRGDEIVFVEVKASKSFEQAAALAGDNLFGALMDAVEHCSLGQITRALYEVGGEYRRNI